MKKLSMLMLGLLLIGSIKIFAQCNAQYTWALTPTGSQPLLVTFTNSSTFGSVPSNSYTWGTIDYGDGNFQSVGTYNSIHQYNTPGTYNTRLIITTADTFTNTITCTDTAFATVTLSYTPCAASIGAVNNSAGSYTFTATSLAGTPGLTYSWNLGDGTTATGSSVTHTYATYGIYHQTLVSVGGGCVDTATYTVNYQPTPVINCDSLVAAFSTNISGLSVGFSNNSTYNASIYALNAFPIADWYFGDGTTLLNSVGAYHTYASTGTYNVTMVNRWKDSTTGQVYCTDTVTSQVTLTNGNPGNPGTISCDSLFAHFTPYASGLNVTFYNSSYSSAVVPNTSLSSVASWNFGDGSSQNNTVNAYHAYASAGTYNVTMINHWQDSISGQTYCTDTFSYQLILTGTGNPGNPGNPGIVSCDSLFAHFTPGISGLTVTFNNTSYSNAVIPNNTLSSVANWNFGDGSSQSNTVNAYHTYASAGTYNVTMINQWQDSITGQTYCTDTFTYQLVLSGGNPGNPGTTSCDSLFAHFTPGISGLTVTFNNTSYSAVANPYLYSVATWSFGDGSYQYNTVNAYHTYASAGTYNVTMINQWQDSITGQTFCTDTFSYQLVLSGGGNPGNPGTVSCDSLFAHFTPNITGLTVGFNNTSYSTAWNTYPYIYPVADWYFGDGSSQLNSTYGYHTYASPGTYTVYMLNSWKDSMTNQVYCVDSYATQITVSNQNIITGNILWDSTYAIYPYDSIKVWLITYDSMASSLTAVDSALLSAYYYNATYQFYNKPAGDYLVKAAFMGQTPGTTGFLPTYHLSSVYWSSATNIAHAGSVTSGKNIIMQTGTVTSGPGFIGGSISMGAGKGTGTGVEGMQVYLRNAGNELIASAITDDAGNYSFSDIPVGSYSVYPEAINYNTTPYNAIQVTASQLHITTIDFEQKDNLIYPKQHGTGISNITKADGLNIYPNPAKTQLFIENKNSLFNKVHIVNTLGQTIQEINLNNGINKIGLTNINSGIYYLLISGPNGSRTTKIIKE